MSGILRGVAARHPAGHALVGLFLFALASCSGAPTGPEGSPKAAQTVGEYASFTDYFAKLQGAGLKADYPAFARLLKAGDPAPVLQDLQRSFRGAPFDAYTANSFFNKSHHRRVVELRNTTGRLYLYLELDKIGPRWSLAHYELGRDKAIAAKL